MKPLMLRTILIAGLCFGLLAARPAVLWGAEPDPAQAVVAVVSLDKKGKPRRQGLGVVVGKDGKVLTSASLLTPGGAIVVRTNKGAKYLVQEVLFQDALQDLAVVKVEADGLFRVEPGAVGRVRPGEVVRVGLQQEKGVVLKEAKVASVHPFSPRLTLVKLTPPLAEAEPGAPLFNSRGELVALVHAFAGGDGGGRGFQVILARDRQLLPRKAWANPAKKASGEGKSPAPSISPGPDLRVSQAEGGAGEKQPENPEAAAYAAFWQGVRASLDLRWQEAQEKFTAALAVPGELPEASFGRGVARYHLEDYEGAVRDCLEASRALPNYALASLWLGKSWERLGNRAEARKAYQQAVSQAPDLKEAWFYLGVLDYQEGRLAQAQKCLERAGDGVEQAARRAFYLGAIARRQGRLEQAQAAFAEAVKRDVGFFPAYLEGGKTLLDLGRPKKAAQLLTELIRRDPKLPVARYYLALAYLAAWNTKGAWEQYFVLQKLDPALASRLRPDLEKGR